MATYQGWQQAILGALHAPPTASNLKFLQAWATAEGGSASNNPFNTTQPASGASNYNSVGVRNYGSPQQGTQATVQTLLNGHYGNIVNLLRSGNADPMSLAQAVAQSPWGTGAGVERVLGGPVNAAWGPGGKTQTGGKPGQGQSGLPPLTPKPGNGLGQLGKFMALNLLSSAGNTVNGGTSNPSNLLTMAMLRNQFNAANQQFGQPIHIPDNSSQAPNVHGGWAGKSLDGSIPMVLGGKSPYSNLKFDGNVDWQHINPRLLRSVNSVAANHGTVVTINSGYRSNSYSHSVGGFAGDPHSKGLAIDAYVNGKPIGDVFGPNVWKNLGITSGAVPNFYNGSSDPEHLQL